MKNQEDVWKYAQPQSIFTPQPEMQKKYIGKYRVYRQLYPALQTTNKEL